MIDEPQAKKPVEPDAVPEALYALGGCCLICLAIVLLAIDPRSGLFFCFFLILPNCLLFHAAGVRMPGLR